MRFVGWFVVAGGLGAAETEAVFLVVGDQHSAYSRTAQVIAHVERLQLENPTSPFAILINGDAFEHGNVVALRSEGAVDLAMFAAFARRAPTIVNLGNHEPEFTDVPATVARIRATGAVPIGNLANRATGELFAPASTSLELGRAKIVIAGITTDMLAQYRAAVQPTLDLTAPGAWAREKFPELLARAPVKIVLSHAGLRLDREIFPHVPAGTLIAGAHDHAQYVERIGRGFYFHSGSWNSHLSIVRLRLEPDGPAWAIEQLAIRESDPADPEMAALIRETERRHLTVEDLRPIGRTSGALSRTDAAARVVRAVARAAGADAAFIGNTTFGDGLPAGEVGRFALDACVRFDGAIWVGEVSGTRLQRLMSESNQGAHTPFVERRGEFQFADGPAEIVAERRYRIATTDWGVRNRERYFGAEEIAFVEKPELRLKAIVSEALSSGSL
jgi:5'-nucleotidase / UDP-sugar diphosphatase